MPNICIIFPILLLFLHWCLINLILIIFLYFKKIYIYIIIIYFFFFFFNLDWPYWVQFRWVVGVDSEVVVGWLPYFHYLSIPLILCATPSILPCHWILPPPVTCCKLFQSLWYRSVFSARCLSVGVSLTTGIKEPLQTGCGAYLRQQACQWDYFKWELESNCRHVSVGCWLWVIIHWFSDE